MTLISHLSSPPPHGGTQQSSLRLVEDVPDDRIKTFHEDYYPGVSLFNDAVDARKIIDSFSESFKSFLLRLSPQDRDIFQKLFLTGAPFSHKQLAHLHHISEDRIIEIAKEYGPGISKKDS